MEEVRPVVVLVDWRREGPRPTRRVSWRPGAEGAERDVVWWEVVCEEEGAMRIAWFFGVSKEGL